MDIYTNPTKNTYVTGITKHFIMPTDSGGIPAVAVSKRAANYITSAYTILMILIFMVGWNLILAIIMSFWPAGRDPNRHTALVALWNSGESMNATVLMLSYCKRMISNMLGGGKAGTHSKEAAPAGGDGGDEHNQAGAGGSPGGNANDAINRSADRTAGNEAGTPAGTPETKASLMSNLLWGLLFVFIAFSMTAGNVISGILVPVQLSMGNVAPPAKDVIFYPDVARYGSLSADNGAGAAKLNSLKAPSALRALGAIEASEVTVRDRVNLRDSTSGESANLEYDYKVTGVDMGLQTDPKLELRIKGSCHTDSTWRKANSTNTEDIYGLFGGDGIFTVKRQPGVNLPPMVTFFIDTTKKGSNISYALIPNTAGLYSNTAGQDPWYATDKAEGEGGVAYQVRGGRPALSCWEAGSWHLNGNDVELTKLTSLPGLKLHKLWTDKVFPFEFGAPRLVSLGRAAGPAALKSVSFAAAPWYVLDAGSSTILGDLERLVLASWVSSRNVLRDTTTYKAGGDIVNIAKGEGGTVDPDSAKFVVQSGDVVTLSVRILISVPVILVFLFILEKILNFIIRHSDRVAKKRVFDEEKNGITLQATYLFRGLNEKLHPQQEWKNTASAIPFLCAPKSAVQASQTEDVMKTGEKVTLKPATP